MSNQSQESHEEQTIALQFLDQMTKSHLEINNASSKATVIAGDPGSGKTTIVCLHAVHCMSCGMVFFATANMSERENQLGVVHVNDLICLPGCNNRSPASMADVSIRNLFRRPEKWS